MSKDYFAIDGNYGDATDLVVLDTTDWTAEDWVLIEEASDWERTTIAKEIASQRLAENE